MTTTELKEYQIEVLGHKDIGFTEYRNIGKDEFVGINPRKTPTGTTNQDVVRITCIVIDIDPFNGGDNAVELAKVIVLLENYQSYVIVNSGRGVHIYVPVDLPITTDVKGYFEYLRNTYQLEGYVIDRIHDLARVIRVWGSINSKNAKRCEIIEDHFQGKNKFKLPTFKQPIENSGTIINGNRNNTLTSLAGTMRNKGMSEQAITAALLEENKTNCKPPLSDSEVIAIAHSVARYTPAPKKETTSLQNISEKYLNNLMSRKAGYSTGFAKLDEMLAGLQKGRMYVLAARTNEGKTSFTCNVVSNLLTQGVSVLYFPTELGYEPLFDKIISQRSDVPLKTFQFGNFTDEQKEKIKLTVKTLQSSSLSIHEDFGLTLQTIVDKTKEIKPQVLVIDFIQAMKFIEGSPAEIGTAVRGIKELAEELSLSVILCCQLNRGAINNEMSLSHLKGSGAIEEFADVVMGLNTLSRFEYPRIVDLHVLKNRYAEVGKVRLNFYSTIGKFEEKTA